ncbi:diaminopimelate epimerase [Caldicellulosiruptor morganii]|uniref:Diaminopimelate epimerase n=1 Tax=Caldicellulosiruptor morganii TaxID=1387555 RepID=A0ABY7BSB7_9FIRM|nr:diaminopimelate epimerase [Caldicellulosiruptor morganii]WAM33393.1 diaminopimelate epimerase [Caldicellulosiruptor morganii]WAM34464.1 diaminopimelate epimerase [Caldicellulosiruptor morganii]
MLFSKMHGLGNDFIVIDARGKEDIDYNSLAKRMCHRHIGVGADGLLLVLDSKLADIRMRIINSDGSEAEMCGNGIRCFSKYVFERGIVKKDKFKVETLAGIIEPELILNEYGLVEKVKVNMGKPSFKRKDIPMQGDPESDAINTSIEVDGKEYKITSLLMGVPHTVLFVDDVEKVDIYTLGPKIERHEVFPRKTNVNFVQVIDKNNIKVRTWERGAGATFACGTGSCASVIASNLNGFTEKKVNVHLYFGMLEIEWQDDGTVFMTGPAEEVFVGEYLD